MSMSAQYFLVHCNPPSKEGHLVLEDGCVVLCSFEEMVVALAVATGDEDFEVVTRGELSKTDRKRVDTVFE